MLDELDEADWPEWIEELFDNNEQSVETKNFDWEFIEDNPNNSNDDIEYA